MSAYSGHTITAVSGDIILLKFIESMHFNDDEEMVVDKLKGDVSLSVRTISGKEYIVSMKSMQKMYNQTNIDLAQAIYDKWIWIHKP